MLHRLNLGEAQIEPVLSGEKTFDIKYNSEEYQKGNHIKYEAISQHGVPYTHPALSKRTYEITYVYSGHGVEKNFVVFGIKEIKNEKSSEEVSDM